ncbi:hypothetical protein MAR_024004, partial [Mya arenaria]
MAMDMKGYFGVYRGRTDSGCRTCQLNEVLSINDWKLNQELQQYNIDLVESSRDEIYELQQHNEYLQKVCQHRTSLQNCNWNRDQRLTQKSNPVHNYHDQYPKYRLEELQLNNEKQTNEELTCIILDLKRKLQQQERDNKISNGLDEEISRLRKELENCKNNLEIQESVKPLENENKLYTEEEQNELALANETIHKMQAKIEALTIELASKKDEDVDTGNETKQLSEHSNLLNKQNHDLSKMLQHQEKEKFDSVMLNNERLEKELEEMINQHQKLKDESKTLRSELHSEQDQNADLQRKIATMSQEKDLCKARLKIETVEQSQKSNNMRSLHDEIIQHKAAVDALAAKNEHLKTQILKANAELKELQNKNDQYNNTLQNRSEELHLIKQENDNNKKHIATLKRENETLKEELGTRMYTQKQPGRISSQNANLERELEKTRHELLEVRHDLEDAKTRLSKVMGQKLTDNNPNIADLSDKNRPTKLAERYSELYDNQWTDAFEIVNNQLHDEKSTIDSLSNILLSAADFCQMESEAQMTALKEILIQNRAGSNFPSL